MLFLLRTRCGNICCLWIMPHLSVAVPNLFMLRFCPVLTYPNPEFEIQSMPGPISAAGGTRFKCWVPSIFFRLFFSVKFADVSTSVLTENAVTSGQAGITSSGYKSSLYRNQYLAAHAGHGPGCWLVGPPQCRPLIGWDRLTGSV